MELTVPLTLTADQQLWPRTLLKEKMVPISNLLIQDQMALTCQSFQNALVWTVQMLEEEKFNADKLVDLRQLATGLLKFQVMRRRKDQIMADWQQVNHNFQNVQAWMVIEKVLPIVDKLVGIMDLGPLPMMSNLRDKV